MFPANRELKNLIDYYQLRITKTKQTKTEKLIEMAINGYYKDAIIAVEDFYNRKIARK